MEKPGVQTENHGGNMSSKYSIKKYRLNISVPSQRLAV